MFDHESVLSGKSNAFFSYSVTAYVEARSGFLAIALCICFAFSVLVIAARRPFGCDEIITVSLAHAATIGDVFAKFRLSFDQTPPLNTILVRCFCSLFGWSELSARLPSIIFATLGLLILFHRVRKLTSGLWGLAAASTLLVTFLPSYAYEARPYAMLFFASCAALSLWTSVPDASSGTNVTSRSIFFGLAMLLAVFAHYYAVLLILPFAAEEARRRGATKVLSPRLLCGIIGMGLALAIHLPFILAASRFRQVPFGGIPSFQNLQGAYVEMLPRFISVLVCLILILGWAYSPTERAVHGPSSHERLGWFFLGIPGAGYILAEVFTHAFWTRYFISVLAGFGLAFGCFLYRRYHSSPWVGLWVLFLAFSLFVEASVSHFQNALTPLVSKRAEESDLADAMLPRFRQEEKVFVLLPTLRSYVEARYYAKNPDMIRVLLPSNYPHWFLTQNPIDIHYFSIDELRRYARKTAFIAPTPEVLSYLEKLGFHIHWRTIKPETVVYAE